MADSSPRAIAERTTPAKPPIRMPGPPRQRERRTRSLGWRSRDILRVTLLVFGVYYALKLFWFVNELVLVAFLAVLFGLAVSAGVDYLQRFRIPRGLAAGLIVLSFFGLVVGTGALMAPTLREQGAELRQRLPEAVERVESWLTTRRRGIFGVLLGGLTGAAPSADSVGAPTRTQPAQQPARRSAQAAAGQPAATGDSASTPPAPASPLRAGLEKTLGSAARYLFPFLTSTVAVVGGLLLIIFLSIYISADPDLYHRGLMHLFPHRARQRAGEVLSAIATVLRKWLVTQLIAMTTIGVVTTIVLLFLHVKAPFALGVIAGVLEFIPTIGPILSAVPAIAMGFLDSPEKALSVLIAYIVIQQLEGHILIPLLMKGGMDLPPVMTILAQALMAILFGFLGLMVAVPMLAAVMVPVKMLYVQDTIGDDIEVTEDDDEALIGDSS